MSDDVRVSTVEVTPAAAQRATAILARAGMPDGGLRVTVQSAGCDGFQALLDLADSPSPGDVVIDTDGVRLFADVASTLKLPGAVLDYRTTDHGAEFVWSHPGSEQGCACAEAELTGVRQD
jgi:iron-sulfur cluster assembly accessory protein